MIVAENMCLMLISQLAIYDALIANMTFAARVSPPSEGDVPDLVK